MYAAENNLRGMDGVALGCLRVDGRERQRQEHAGGRYSAAGLPALSIEGSAGETCGHRGLQQLEQGRGDRSKSYWAQSAEQSGDVTARSRRFAICTASFPPAKRGYTPGTFASTRRAGAARNL